MLTIKIRDVNTFNILLESFPHWCRDVEGLSGQLLPDGNNLIQGGKYQTKEPLDFKLPHWVERAHLGPVREPTGWYEMTGSSTIAVLYRGVFVQQFKIDQIWGIEGSIDVNPKHFKPSTQPRGVYRWRVPTRCHKFLEVVPPHYPRSYGPISCGS